MDFDYLHAIRQVELERLLPLIPPGSSILEIGAGAGWQAKLLSAHGFPVQAIDVDVDAPGYREARVWPVLPYDGHRIPFAAAQFDVVFSSNVLEHIAHLEAFQREIRRVLRAGGRAVHVVPTGTWRFWTNLTYYPELARRYRHRGRNGRGLEDQPTLQDGNTIQPHSGPVESGLAKIGRLMLSPRHGEKGDALSEMFHFSRWAWQQHFRRTGWQIDACFPNRLYYSGYALLGPGLSMGARTLLSRVLGSSCLIFVLRPS